MLDDTLVVWTTEFGRTPFNDRPGTKGREHHAGRSRRWLAGGGVKGGIAYGATDEHGINVAEGPGPRPRLPRDDPAPAGPGPQRLTYRHAGRDFRLTDVHGQVHAGNLGLISLG